MANTYVFSDKVMSITFDGSTAWDSTTTAGGNTTTYPNGMLIESIEYLSGGTAGAMTIRAGAAANAKMFMASSTVATDRSVKYFNAEKSQKRLKPYVVGNEASSGAQISIVLK